MESSTESATAIMQGRAQWLALIHRYQPERDAHILVIKSLANEGKLSATVEQIIGSLVHMHCNRLFIADQRAHEAVFYDFLDRIQESLLASDRIKVKSTG
jgi:thiopeptide-type bacteriocin biosynthesis protein